MPAIPRFIFTVLEPISLYAHQHHSRSAPDGKANWVFRSQACRRHPRHPLARLVHCAADPLVGPGAGACQPRWRGQPHGRRPAGQRVRAVLPRRHNGAPCLERAPHRAALPACHAGRRPRPRRRHVPGARVGEVCGCGRVERDDVGKRWGSGMCYLGNAARVAPVFADGACARCCSPLRDRSICWAPLVRTRPCRHRRHTRLARPRIASASAVCTCRFSGMPFL